MLEKAQTKTNELENGKDYYIKMKPKQKKEKREKLVKCAVFVVRPERVWIEFHNDQKLYKFAIEEEDIKVALEKFSKNL